ncbi:PREDICTED: transcription factor GTE12-like [Ipomoea nil]|uniref:transcription factor GTE12-like n=1 Tax=Ipomoea nil TaxID=35883 RepID=UPI000901095B|nr:PREDICTED: transcription factor GTE12-like [Ipomoea nil]XP_019190193.1 PREDICTED: transcription factor GTE12-like [Ipomoea nil]
MTVTGAVVKRLKIKISSKGVRTHYERDSQENVQSLQNSVDAVKKPEMNLKFKLPVPANSNKRGPQGTLDGEKGKRQKMDRSIKQQCGTILQALMTHDNGWPFLHPVDPVFFNIPDYFAIITKPMDLGTVKSKLEGNMYFSVEEFAADVRLTFANSMTYNPPTNRYHTMAKELDSLFNKRWKLMEAKWKSKSGGAEQGCLPNRRGKDFQDMNKSCLNKAPLHVNPVTKRLMRIEDKEKLKNELLELLRGKVVDNMQSTLQKFGLGKEKLNVEIHTLDDETLLELKRVLVAALDAVAAKAESAEGMHVFSAKSNHKVSLVDSQYASSGNSQRRCYKQSVCSAASSRDLSSKRVSEEVQCTSLKLDGEMKSSSTGSQLIFDANGAGSQKEKESPSSDHSSCATTTTTGEGCTSLADVQLSPTKARRAAMLMSRFAETIFKAKHQVLEPQGDTANSLKLQQERERLLKQQLAEKARIEEQIRVAEEASRMRAEAELKIQREREREAARIALEKMEKTVEFDDIKKIMRELERLCGCPYPDDPLGSGYGVNFSLSRKPLERLGLYIKDDLLEEDDDEAVLNGDGEDGEIL